MDTQSKQDKPRIQLESKVYKGILMFKNEIEAIEKMKMKEDDIWVCSNPRSGTTMTQEMVYLVATLDFETASKVQLDSRFPIIEILDDRFPYYKGLALAEALPSPRMIKSHLHYFLLPEQLQAGKGRIIYISRNPKDIVCSFYRLLEWGDQLTENSFNEFFDNFVNGTGMNCPWPRHVLEFWNKRNEKHVLFLKYEDVIKDMPKTVKQVAEFLKKDLTDDQIDKISKHCHVDAMRANDMVNGSYYRTVKYVNDNVEGRFINKGTVGEWQKVLTHEMSSRIDKMLQELDGSGLSFEEK